jgi:hypothetical protein
MIVQAFPSMAILGCIHIHSPHQEDIDRTLAAAESSFRKM